MWRPNRIGNYRNATLNGRTANQFLNITDLNPTSSGNEKEIIIKNSAFLPSLGTKERNEGIIQFSITMAANLSTVFAIRLTEKKYVSQQIQCFLKYKIDGLARIAEALEHQAYLGILETTENETETTECNKYIMLETRAHHPGYNGKHISGFANETIILRQDDSTANIENSPGLALIFKITNQGSLSTINGMLDFAMQRYETDIITHDPGR